MLLYGDPTRRPPLAGELRLAGRYPANRAIPRRSRGLTGGASGCAQRGDKRRGFTLFELILAIALSATLLVLVGTAINLYLLRVDASRARVEEAQLARSVLAMIADDLRATFIYAPQDTAAAEELAASVASYDVDAIDAPNSTGSAGSASSAGSATSLSSSSSTSASGSSGSNSEAEGVLPLGLHGTLGELMIDVDRLPRLDGPLAASNVSGGATTGALGDAGGQPRISDVKTVRYFVRQGEAVRGSSTAATALSSPEGQARVGGLVRQELDRAVRTWAEEAGNQAMLQTTGLALVAPEVVQVAFRYYNGSEVLESWDMEEMGGLPLAVEVRIWIASRDAATSGSRVQYGSSNVAGAKQFRQTVYLPLSALAAGTGGTSSSTAEDAGDGGDQ